MVPTARYSLQCGCYIMIHISYNWIFCYLIFFHRQMRIEKAVLVNPQVCVRCGFYHPTMFRATIGYSELNNWEKRSFFKGVLSISFTITITLLTSDDGNNQQTFHIHWCFYVTTFSICETLSCCIWYLSLGLQYKRI